MRKACFLICTALVFGCKGVTEKKLPLLNGYWEIEKVVFDDGNTKEFTVGPTVDYIKLEGKNGFRKKMQPLWDGTYQTSDDAEMFTIDLQDGHFVFSYKTELSTWSEEIMAISKDRFSVRNLDNKTYYYKRFEPINIQE